MPSLKNLEALGCYVNAGHLDHYDGLKHTRLGDVTADGDVVFTEDGQAYADELAAGSSKRRARAKPAPENASLLDPLDPDLQALAED